MLDDAFDRVFCVIGALFLNQFPRYMIQYMDVLAKFTSGKLNTAVLIKKKPLEPSMIDTILVWLKDFGLNISFGRDFANNLERVQFYQKSIAEWNGVTSVEKPFIFLSNIDFDVVKYMDFTIILQKDMQGMLYAFAGIFAGAIAYKLCIKAPYYLFFVKERNKIRSKGKGPGPGF